MLAVPACMHSTQMQDAQQVNTLQVRKVHLLLSFTLCKGHFGVSAASWHAGLLIILLDQVCENRLVANPHFIAVVAMNVVQVYVLPGLVLGVYVVDDAVHSYTGTLRLCSK